MTIVQIGNYRLKCESCGVLREQVGFDLDKVYLWANGYGSKIRLFCHRCGAVHDVLIKPDVDPVITLHSMKAAIFNGQENLK